MAIDNCLGLQSSLDNVCDGGRVHRPKVSVWLRKDAAFAPDEVLDLLHNHLEMDHLDSDVARHVGSMQPVGNRVLPRLKPNGLVRAIVGIARTASG